MYIYGKHSIRTALKHHRGLVRRIYHEPGKDASATFGGLILEIETEEVAKWRLDQFAKGGNNQGFVAELERFPLLGERELRADAASLKEALILIADGILDPRNLGAMIRTLVAAGGFGIIVPQDRSAPISGATVHASAGCAFLTKIYQVKNLVRSIGYLKDAGFWIFGLDPQSTTSLVGFDFPQKTGIVVGSEEMGMRRLVRKACDELLRIPQVGRVQSLNASVAAALALYEYARARNILK